MDRLRSDDFLDSYWLGSGMVTFWLVERQNEFFLQSITPESGWTAEHFHKRDDGGAQRDAICRVLALVGLTEFPVYADYKYIPKVDETRLNEQFKIYESEVKRIKEERDEALKQKNESEVSEDTPQSKPDLKLVESKQEEKPETIQ